MTAPTVRRYPHTGIAVGDVITVRGGSGARGGSGQPLRHTLMIEVTALRVSRTTGRTYIEGFHVTSTYTRRRGNPVRAAYIQGPEIAPDRTWGQWQLARPAPQVDDRDCPRHGPYRRAGGCCPLWPCTDH